MVSVDIDELWRLQAYVASRGQLRDLGITRHRIRNQVAARRWQTWGSVVIGDNAPLTREQFLWSAVLDQTQPCLLAGVTALIAAGLRTYERPQIHVVLGRGATIRRRPGVVHTTARALGSVTAAGPPRVSSAVAAIQAGLWERPKKDARGLVIASVQQRLTTVEALEAALDLAQPNPRTRTLRALIQEMHLGADSSLELDFLRLAQQAGLPAPRRQVPHVVDGRRRRVDFDFERFVVEVEGPLHASSDPDAEAMRRNDVSRGGRPILQFTSTLIRFEPDRVIATLRGAWRDLAA